MTAIPQNLVQAAEMAGMHDASDLALLDIANLPRDGSGRVQGAREVVEQLRRDKPNLFAVPKNARDMTAAEAAAYIRELERKSYADPAPLPVTSKRAKDMTIEERAEFVRAYHKKFPDQARFLSIPRHSPFKA